MADDGLTARGLESSLNRLEVIVAALERDDLELETALALFEEGIGCVRHAREVLRVAELRIEQLLGEGVPEGASEAAPEGAPAGPQ